MKITISERKVNKPLDYPVMIMNTKNNYPVVKEIHYPVPKTTRINNVIDVETQEVPNHKQRKFQFNPPSNATFHIKPTASTKNDQVHLLIQSFADQYREVYQQLDKLFNKDGITLPEQDKIFFETIITKGNLDYFFTTNEDISDYTREQLSFTWRKAHIKEISEECIYSDVSHFNAEGYNLKLKFPSCLSLSIDQRLKEKPLREYLDRSKTLLKDEKVILQFGFQASEREWYKEGETALKNLPKRIREKGKNNHKLSEHGFDCTLRLIVKSPNKDRCGIIARGFIFALSQLNGENELISERVKERQFDKWMQKKVKPRKLDVSLSFKNRFLLTPKEIAHFIKLPESNLQKEFEIVVDDRDEINVPKSLLAKDGILIGYSEIKGVRYPISLPTNNLDDVAKPYIFCGSPRQGKDVGQINFIVEAAKQGYGAFIPDVINEKGNKRGMSDSIRDSLPPDKIIDLDFGDYDYPIYFGLEDIIEKLGSNGLNIVANNLIKILKLDDHATTQRACRLIAKACKCNLYKMSLFVRSDQYAIKMLESIRKNDELLALQLENEYLNNSKMNVAKDTLYTRLDEILGNDHFRNMMAQEPNIKLNFEKWIKEGKVVIARMKKIDIGDIGVQILLYLFTMKLFWLKKIMETDDMTFLVLNEPHQFMSKPLEELLCGMLVESPKYRFGLLMAFHDKSFISKELYSAIKSAALNWFMYKTTNKDMYESIKEELSPITIEMAMRTEKHESIFMPFINGRSETPFFMKMLPPPFMRMELKDNSFVSLECSKMYGVPVTEVLKTIKEKEISLYKNDKVKYEHDKSSKKNKK